MCECVLLFKTDLYLLLILVLPVDRSSMSTTASCYRGLYRLACGFVVKASKRNGQRICNNVSFKTMGFVGCIAIR